MTRLPQGYRAVGGGSIAYALLSVPFALRFLLDDGGGKAPPSTFAPSILAIILWLTPLALVLGGLPLLSYSSIRQRLALDFLPVAALLLLTQAGIAGLLLFGELADPHDVLSINTIGVIKSIDVCIRIPAWFLMMWYIPCIILPALSWAGTCLATAILLQRRLQPQAHR